MESNKGYIGLKGAINVEDKFTYTWKDGELDIEIGEKVNNVLKRTRCSIHDISFNTEHNLATVLLRFPLIGVYPIKLTHSSKLENKKIYSILK